jgi:hypothetical protein
MLSALVSRGPASSTLQLAVPRQTPTFSPARLTGAGSIPSPSMAGFPLASAVLSPVLVSPT